MSSRRAAIRPAADPVFGVPLAGPLESRFGYRWGRLHRGVDIGALASDKVRAPRAGLVALTGWIAGYEGYGLVVKLRHRGGMTTLFAHLSRVRVKKGDWVERGALLGRAGCTGWCSGPHLHFEVRMRGKLMNPLGFLDNRLRPLP